MKLACLVSVCILSLVLSGCANSAEPQLSEQGISLQPINLDGASKTLIGKKIWFNEAGGTLSGLTHWNTTEGFASLGIGHFIWYPAGKTFVFKESFPDLIRYMLSQNTEVPDWLIDTPCPWPDLATFNQDKHSEKMVALRRFLAETVDLQLDFIVLRSQQALAKMVDVTQPSDRDRLIDNYYAVAQTPRGIYALIDYVNFKGEGINPSERYKGYGWGLKDVLLNMEGSPQGVEAAHAFGQSAEQILTRRAHNGPAKDLRWLPGWLKRCESYSQPLGASD